MAKTDDDLRVEIASTMLRVFNKVQADSRSERDFGNGISLTMVEAEIVALIFQGHEIAADIATELGVTQSAVSQVLRRLKDKGFVTAGRDETNARRRPLSLTATGQAATGAIMSYYAEMNDTIFSASGRELKHYLRFVTELETFLDSHRER